MVQPTMRGLAGYKKGRQIIRRNIARKRLNATRRRGRFRRLKLSGASSGFPQSILMKHKYVQRVALSCTSGALAVFRIAANNLYNPGYSGTHQPYYRDQMLSLYNNALVYGNKITIRPASDVGTDFRLLVRPTMDATVIADMVLEMERPGSIYKTVSDENPDRGVIKAYRKTQQVSGYPGSLDISWHNLNGSYPSDQWYWQIAAQPADQTTTTVIYVDIECIFYTLWWDRLGVAQS